LTSKLIHPELSYKVRGVLLKVYNTLGPMLKEEYYRDAIILGLKKCQIVCQAEKMFEVYDTGNQSNTHRVVSWGKLVQAKTTRGRTT
jgi:hypothetical protein